MIKEKVFQFTTFTCDKCSKSKIVECELEDDCNNGKYVLISEFVPEGFNEIEDLKIILCDECLAKLKEWTKG